MRYSVSMPSLNQKARPNISALGGLPEGLPNDTSIDLIEDGVFLVHQNTNDLATGQNNRSGTVLPPGLIDCRGPH